MGSGDKKLEYDQVRGYVLSLAQQRGSAMTPKPNDVMGVDDQEVGTMDPERYTAEEWMSWVGAVSTPVTCWICGQT
eukprot:11382630-Karenia_brevis.AAC.1